MFWFSNNNISIIIIIHIDIGLACKNNIFGQIVQPYKQAQQTWCVFFFVVVVFLNYYYYSFLAFFLF